MREAGLKVAVASSAKKDELEKYLEIGRITDLVDLTLLQTTSRNPNRRLANDYVY